MKLYVISVEGTDDKKIEISGLITTNSTIGSTTEKPVLLYTEHPTINNTPSELSSVYSNFDFVRAEKYKTKIDDAIKLIPSVNLTFSVIHYEFDTDIMSTLAKTNCTRLNIHSEEIVAPAEVW